MLELANNLSFSFPYPNLGFPLKTQNPYTISFHPKKMGCHGGSSSWLCPGTTVISPYSGNAKYQGLFSSHKSTAISCSSNGPTHNSSSSSSRHYSRPSSDPLRDRAYGKTSPEVLRRWIEADHQPLASQERFTIVSYNILGVRNASKHGDLYPNVPSPYMRWDHRKRVICEELVGWNPDIICLQEVDRYFDLSNVLKKAGYVGSYKRRTGDNVDGCAMFWKADVVRLLDGESIEFKCLGLRDNVAQLHTFEISSRGEPRRLLVGNTHVLYNPSRGDVKLGQIRSLLLRAHILSEKWGNTPLVVAGDFNTTPQSAIYKFMCLSELNILLYDRRELSGQRNCHPAQVFGQQEMRSSFSLMDGFFTNNWTGEEVKVATGNSEHHLAVHPLKLKSSYATIKSSAGTRDFNCEPFATSYHSKFFGTVDYLWYSDGIVPTRVLDTLPFAILRKKGGLPCKKLGSDHLALVSEFAFIAQETKEGNATTSASATAASRADEDST